MKQEQNKRIVKIIETTKGQIYSPFSNADKPIKLMIFNQILSSQASRVKSGYLIDLEHLNFHKCHPFSLQNQSVGWASIEHEIREVLSRNKISEQELVLFDSSGYNEKIPQILNRFRIVKGYNYRIKLDSFQKISEDKKALLTEEHVSKQIQMEFSLGNGSFKPGYIGQINFQEIQNPIFNGIIKAYISYSSKTQCPIFINFASQGQHSYQYLFQQNSQPIIENIQNKLQILYKFLDQCKLKNCSQNLILYNLPIVLIQKKSSFVSINYFQKALQNLIENYDVTLGFKILRYSLFNEKEGINEIIKLVNKYPHKTIISAGIKYKTDLIVNGGQGLSLYDYQNRTEDNNILHMNSSQYLRQLVSQQNLEQVMKLNILRLFDWKEFKEEVKIEIFWKCDSCSLDFSQSIKAFGKFGKQFCSIKCLKVYKF